MFLGYVPSSMGEATLDWIGQLGSVTNSWTSLTFGSVTIPYDSLVIVAFAGIGTNSVTVSGITVAGSTTTLHAKNSSAAGRHYALASVFVPAGSANVAVTCSGSVGTSCSHGVGVWTLRAPASMTPQGANGAQNSATSISITHNQVAPGYSVYGAMAGEHTAGGATLSGSAVINYQAKDTNGREFTYGFIKRAATATPWTETFTMNTSDHIILTGGSWT